MSGNALLQAAAGIAFHSMQQRMSMSISMSMLRERGAPLPHIKKANRAAGQQVHGHPEQSRYARAQRKLDSIKA